MFDKLKSKIAEKMEQTRLVMELPAASESVREERLAICRSCEELRPSEFCKLCNCYMPAKVFIAGVSCPDKKWVAVQTAKTK